MPAERSPELSRRSLLAHVVAGGMALSVADSAMKPPCVITVVCKFTHRIFRNVRREPWP